MWLAQGKQAVREFLDSPRFRENRRIRIGTYVCLAVVMYLILLGSVLPPSYHFKVGETSPVTIVAPVTAVDTAATQAARAEAMKRVSKQYVQLASVETQALASLDRFFAAATQVVPDPTLTRAEKVASLAAAAPKGVTQPTLQLLAGMSLRKLEVVQSVSEHIVRVLLGAPFDQEKEQQAELLIDRQMLPYDLDRVSQLVVQNVVQSVLRPNMVYQPEATREAQLKAASEVPPVMIQKGDVIVSRNGVITPQVLSRLRDVGLDRQGPNYAMATGFALLIAIAIGLLGIYVERRSPRRRLDNMGLIITALVLVLT
ncbi:MAG: metal-dependent phosphohydrolase, partial [Alicyclobacillus sp.]|nr:metal-dependent phosphohydrolase [Alicyclobacillus sp.]